MKNGRTRRWKKLKCKLILEIRELHADPSDRSPKKLEVPKDILSSIEVVTIEHEIDKEAALKTERAKT